MNKKTIELLEAERGLREKLAKKRNNLFRLDDWIPVLKETVSQVVKVAVQPSIEKPKQQPIVKPKGVPNIKKEILELEKEIDELTKNPIDLSKKHWVTQIVIDNSAAFIDTAKEEDFQKIEFINELENWWILNVWLEWFEYFKILRVVKTQTGKNICVVNFKKSWYKKAKTDLLVMFPIIENWTLQIYSPKTQELMWNYKIKSAKLNKKTILEKALDVFWL